MQIKTLLTSDLTDFYTAAKMFEDDVLVQSIIMFLPEGNQWSDDEINHLCTLVSKPMIGGIFPQIMFEQQCHTTGALLLGTETLLDVHTLAFSSEVTAADVSAQLMDLYPEHQQQNTLLVISDGLASGMTNLIDELFNHFGLDINFIGGGAGSLTLVPKPCVLTNAGLQQGVAAIALLNCQSGIGVAHGWQSINDAYRVTESTGNRVISLNWQPAFEVYTQAIFTHSQQVISPDNFFDIAKAYPLGITKLGAELVIRDPIMTQDGCLVCVGDVPQGSFVHIMNGDPSTLPQAAMLARKKAAQSLGAQQQATFQLFIDCISRVLFLGPAFAHELAYVVQPGLPMVGALTLGEIANSGADYLEFYNKTAVVALMKDI
jgi:hypothetical protein